MKLPTKEQINPIPCDLDGQCAVENFFGKNREQIASEFSEHGMSYMEDLMFVGPVAFIYYFPAALTYLFSQESIGDADFVSCLCGVIEFRLEHDRDEIVDALPQILRFAEAVMESYGKFEIDEQIYGDIRTRYRRISESLVKS